MKIGIMGSRRRNTDEDQYKVTQAFLKLKEEYPNSTIVSGGCPTGEDRFAEIIACLNNVPIKIYYADWNTFGRIAGFIRNTDIAKESDILIACIHPERTGGTEDTIKKFIKFHPEGKIILV